MKRVCMALIRFYQKRFSPLKRRGCCRFYPTCSSYALEAFEKRGFFAGLLLTVLRILRCQPLCRGGYDPVPERGFRRYSPPSEEETPSEEDPLPSSGELTGKQSGKGGGASPVPIPKYQRTPDSAKSDFSDGRKN